MSVANDELYDSMVCDVAADLADALDFSAEGRAAIASRELNVEDVLADVRAAAYENLKEFLRPAYYSKVKELGAAD